MVLVGRDLFGLETGVGGSLEQRLDSSLRRAPVPNLLQSAFKVPVPFSASVHLRLAEQGEMWRQGVLVQLVPVLEETLPDRFCATRQKRLKPDSLTCQR